MKNLEYFMGLNYSLEVKPMYDFDDSIYFVAKYKELDGLEGVGETEQEAIDDLKSAKEGWFELGLEMGVKIPEPIISNPSDSVKITYRMPNSLNYQIDNYSENEGISKNSAITQLLYKGLYENSLEVINDSISYSLVNKFLNFFFNEEDSRLLVHEEELCVYPTTSNEKYKTPQLTFNR